MADYNYSDLVTKYGNFAHPLSVILIDGVDFNENKFGFITSDIDVESTSGFEASIASFVIYNTFDMLKSEFRVKDAKKYITLGSSVEIDLGYGNNVVEVFRGFISQVNFVFQQGEVPGIRVTALDIKGIMMSGTYSKQLTAKVYSEAVEEILKRTNYEKLKSDEIVKNINISDTPDKQSSGGGEGGQKEETDITMEMVAESDYDFVVKAAKKFNYEFFTVGGNVYFRKARSEEAVLMELGPETLMRNVDMEFDITGLVGSVEVRDLDVGKGKLISATAKLNNKISLGSKAKSLVSPISKVVIDPAVRSKEDADNRAEFISQDIAYKFGTMTADFVGLPELVPGRFVVIHLLGEDLPLKFYVYSVRHIMGDDGYMTRIIGKTSSIEAAK